jgi:hypothetical protein
VRVAGVEIVGRPGFAMGVSGPWVESSAGFGDYCAVAVIAKTTISAKVIE